LNADVTTSLEVRMDTWQKYAAELLGTFVLVFGGTTAIVASGLSGSPVLIVAALAFGLALLAGLYAFGEVSGGHYNPAVSLAMFLLGRLPSAELVRYWIAQFAGGILAALVLLIATSQDDVASTATVPGAEGSGTAFLIELVFTTIFVAVILQASVSGQFGGSALLAIPLALTDLIGNEWDGIWIYFIAPPLGAVIAAAIHRFVHGGVTPRPTAPAAEVLQEGDRPAR
jgi:glycerol uptake facilitator-like aquaporin